MLYNVILGFFCGFMTATAFYSILASKRLPAIVCTCVALFDAVTLIYRLTT